MFSLVKVHKVYIVEGGHLNYYEIESPATGVEVSPFNFKLCTIH